MKQLDQTLKAFHPVGSVLSVPSESLSLINEARAARDLEVYPNPLVVKVVPQSGCQGCVLNFVDGLCLSRCNASTRPDKIDIAYCPAENQE